MTREIKTTTDLGTDYNSVPISVDQGVQKYSTAPSRASHRNTCLGFNWISRCGGNVEETLKTSNGANLQRSETSSYPPFAPASNAVRAVFRHTAVDQNWIRSNERSVIDPLAKRPTGGTM